MRLITCALDRQNRFLDEIRPEILPEDGRELHLARDTSIQ
jgi:hypothetical protein